MKQTLLRVSKDDIEALIMVFGSSQMARLWQYQWTHPTR